MEFDSPDVERDFPGLYASESGKKSDNSDFSDEGHEKISKKDLLIGKRKDKKDRGYATLEGESSPEEDPDIKSPSKSKKSKTFKFSTKKEKREKSRDKEVKEKEVDKDKRKSDDKEKKKERVKLKLKDLKRKSKQEDSIEGEDLPVFGVPLSIATERSKCHDGVDIPLVVRQCIDHIQHTGLLAENIYKISGIKSRVQHVKKLYNQRELVSLSDYDLPIATSLLKQFLRELPEPIFTKDLVGKFEDASSLPDTSNRISQMKSLIDQLPSCNRVLLAWIVKHLESVSAHEKQNKMSCQSIASILSPVLQSSQKLLTVLLNNSNEIFPNITLTRYVPPQTCSTLTLPDNVEAIEEELKKQESLLEQIHFEMNRGHISKTKEEQLWEVQRIITQLKRKLRSLERIAAGAQRSMDETDSSVKTENEEVSQKAAVVESSSDGKSVLSSRQSDDSNSVKSLLQPCPKPMTAESLEIEDINQPSIQVLERKQLAVMESEELTNVIINLRALCELEMKEINRIKNKIYQLGGNPEVCSKSFLSDDCDDEIEEDNEDKTNKLLQRKHELKLESKKLKIQRDSLIKEICQECDICVDLRIQIKYLQMNKAH